MSDLLKEGTLFWMRTVAPRTVEIPLRLLSSEQTLQLCKYLEGEDYICDESNRTRIVWEFFSVFDGTVVVPELRLTSRQKHTLVPLNKSDPNTPSYSNTNFVEMRKAVENGNLHWQEASKIITNLKSRPWATKQWKIRRDELIGDVCQECGKSGGGLVLQHTRQPRKPETVIQDLFYARRDDYDSWLVNNKGEIDFSAVPLDADACPSCKSQNVFFRKTKKDWICRGVKRALKCGHVFHDPLKQKSNEIVSRIEKEAKLTLKSRFIEVSGIGWGATLTAIDELIEYLEMGNTKTLCKSCAFVEDKTEMVLCKFCGERYHRKSYDRCIKCADQTPEGNGGQANS